MKSRILIALAAVGTYAWSASAFAGGMHEAQLDRGMSVEVQAPSSVNESAPHLSGGAHLGASQSSMAFRESRDFDSDSALGTGATSSVSGSGSVSSDPVAENETTEYWLIGSENAESNAGFEGSESPGG